ncbi:hypothetical protein B0H17DRAFT_1136994 [Mycena rosella]|uniref:Reverse transcriptase n=2 Tax=Mycena rosella TaxID=1033263 RepID=A0AAD7D9Z9_MYCRO|nr:hypothetical protein B0H17DRAFT_1136994 [Mycena rosella]
MRVWSIVFVLNGLFIVPKPGMESRAPPSRTACAIPESLRTLLKNGLQGYWMDLVYALKNLCSPVDLPALPDLTSLVCAELGKAVYSSAMKHLEAEMAASTRLYLLHDRREPLAKEAPKKITVVFRHYLGLITNAKHRKALTRLLVSQHPLAVERMRYKSRYHRATVARDDRLCRFGCNATETVEHALFFCEADPGLGDLRAKFVAAMQHLEPRICSVSPWNATNILKSIIFWRDTVCRVAKFAYRVFGIFDTVPMVWPEARAE